MYMVIMLLLTLLSIYLIVDNSQQKGYAETYTSYVNDVSYCCEHACCRDCTYVKACLAKGSGALA